MTGYHAPLWTGATIDFVLFERENRLTPTRQGTYELISDHNAVWPVFLLGRGSARSPS